MLSVDVQDSIRETCASIRNLIGTSDSERTGINTIRGQVIPAMVRAFNAITRAAGAVEDAAHAHRNATERT